MDPYIEGELEHQIETYKGATSREFKLGHRFVVLVHVWTDPPEDGEGRTFGLRLTVAKYLNVAAVLGNLGV